MELKGYLQTLQRWWWLIAVVTLCAGVTSWVASSYLSPVYEAKALLMANQSENTGVIDFSSLMGGQQVLETYRELLKAPSLLEEAIRNLNLPWTVGSLSERIEVKAIPDTQLLVLSVRDNDAQRAADIANEIAYTFVLQRSSERQLHDIEEYERILVGQMQVLEGDIEDVKVQIEQLRASPALAAQETLKAVQATHAQQQQVYSSLLSSYLSLRAVKSRLLDIVVVEPAQVPASPVSPQRTLYTGAASLSGCVIAGMLIFLLEYLTDTLEDASDAQEALSAPSLGEIPFTRAWQRAGPTLDTREGPIADAFRIIRTNLRFASVDHQVQRLVVSSPEPGDGKTTVVANLGAVMAQGGRSVLLVDADLRRPRLHVPFGVSSSVGLTSVLSGDAALEECVVETSVPGLHLLPSGPLPPNPADLLGSQRMVKLIAELEAVADVVLFDATPILVGADAVILASQTDGVVLVVSRRSTRREAARRAVEALRSAQSKVLGLVVNRGSVSSSGYYHYYRSQNREARKHFWGGLRPWRKKIVGLANKPYRPVRQERDS